jgi:hypothetical protein
MCAWVGEGPWKPGPPTLPQSPSAQPLLGPAQPAPDARRFSAACEGPGAWGFTADMALCADVGVALEMRRREAAVEALPVREGPEARACVHGVEEALHKRAVYGVVCVSCACACACPQGGRGGFMHAPNGIAHTCMPTTLRPQLMQLDPGAQRAKVRGVVEA